MEVADVDLEALDWEKFYRDYALAMWQFSDRRQQLMEVAGAGDLVALGRAAKWWDGFVEALQWALAKERQETENEPDWMLPYAERATVQHWSKQLQLARVVQRWAHDQIWRAYGRKR